MSKTRSNPTLSDNVKTYLSDGETRTIDEIFDAVKGKKKSIDTAVRRLEKKGEITRVDQGIYRLKEVQDAPAAVENSRGESENIETINKMLNAYDTVLDDITKTLTSELAAKASIEEKIDLIKSLRWVAATIDQLMKRWYLVHRGYDTNTRQAVEDAKQKTVDREKQDVENAPPKDQIDVVMEYDESMRDILAKMPKPLQEETKV